MNEYLNEYISLCLVPGTAGQFWPILDSTQLQLQEGYFKIRTSSFSSSMRNTRHSYELLLVTMASVPHLNNMRAWVPSIS